MKLNLSMKLLLPIVVMMMLSLLMVNGLPVSKICKRDCERKCTSDSDGVIFSVCVKQCLKRCNSEPVKVSEAFLSCKLECAKSKCSSQFSSADAKEVEGCMDMCAKTYCSKFYAH
ncbi:hypothetical protein Tsubulata_033556 [Turnera subulata]|uniref:Uncharacterized protein n=1 Tax=Turnera subulata TaxID=218843 RepID=A0A9Q0JS16_9ROSI|nr:hypothetical protein Tsubulata_033556 [Turnera subulata]